MEIRIEKEVITKDDVVGEPLYTVHIRRGYGTGDFHWKKEDMLFKFDEEDITELSRKLSERFLTPTPNPQPPTPKDII